jgi:hypothetical protein
MYNAKNLHASAMQSIAPFVVLLVILLVIIAVLHSLRFRKDIGLSLTSRYGSFLLFGHLPHVRKRRVTSITPQQATYSKELISVDSNCKRFLCRKSLTKFGWKFMQTTRPQLSNHIPSCILFFLVTNKLDKESMQDINLEAQKGQAQALIRFFVEKGSLAF